MIPGAKSCVLSPGGVCPRYGPDKTWKDFGYLQDYWCCMKQNQKSTIAEQKFLFFS